MTRRHLILATVAMMIAAIPALAVGTVNQSLAQIPGSTNYVFTENWTGDASTGSVPATVMLGAAPIQGYRIVSVEIAPGSPAPTNLYTVTVTDFSGADLLGGSGTNQSSITPTILPSLSTAPPIYGSLTVNVTGNSVASAQGRVLVYFAPVSQVIGNTPTGASLTGNNLFTGANTFQGTTTLGVVTGTVTTSILNNVYYAASYAGATWDVKVNNCLKAIQATGVGGLCDTTGLNGAQTASGDMFTGITGAVPLEVLLDAQVVVSVSATQNIPSFMTIMGRNINGSRFRINMTTGNVFNVTGQHIEMGNISQDLAAITRTAGYFVNSVATGNFVGGYFHDIKLVDPYGGFLVQGSSANAVNSYSFNNITYATSGSAHSAALFKIGGGDGSPVANTTISNVRTEGTNATYDEPQMLFDSGVDTLKITTTSAGYSVANPSTFPCILIQNSHPASSWAPRWVRFMQMSEEGGQAGTSTADDLDITAGTNITIESSYFLNAVKGINITGGAYINISNSIIGNNLTGGLNVAGSLSDLHLAVHGNTFGGNSRTTTNTTDDITIGASTTDFTITNNHFGVVPGFVVNASRYGITLTAGAGNFTVMGNETKLADMGTGFINNATGGATQQLVQNTFESLPAFRVVGNAFNNQVFELDNFGASGDFWRFGELFSAHRMSLKNITSGNGAWSFLINGSGFEGILSHTNTATRTYTFPDAGGTVPLLSLAQTWSANQSFNSGTLLPSAAGGTDLGSTTLPFGNAWLGTAATNNFKIQPAATTGARVITITDPVSPTTVGLPLTIASGTATMTTGAITTLTCGTVVTVSATGVATTDSIFWNDNAQPAAATNGILPIKAWPTAGNVNFFYCNPTAGSVTPAAATLNWRVVR